MPPPTSSENVTSLVEVTPPVEAVTVTVVAPAPSDTLDGLVDRLSRTLSLSVSFAVVPFTVMPVALPVAVSVSSPSSTLSSMGDTVTVALPLLSPSLIVMVKSETLL